MISLKLNLHFINNDFTYHILEVMQNEKNKSVT